MKKMSKLIVAAAVSAALFGTGSAMAEDTIKVGIAGPVTGPVAQYGDMEFTGGLMAVEQINAAGGVNGDNAAQYAATGVDVLVTSWPYFGKPADIKVVMEKAL